MIFSNASRVFVMAALVTLALSTQASAQQRYGYTEFEASGSRAAHVEFTTGLLQMHNFEYEDARESFQSALSIDPDFTMAYWGEALSYEHSFWGRFDTDASRAVLARLGATSVERASKAKTDREKAYLHTIEILFSEGTQEEREIRYSEALRQLHERYPEDLDAAAFYALSILFTTYGGRDYTRYMQAAAITEDILDKNPRHPGALHYSIHSYDDPIHAPLGLRAARDYFQVAPSAIHALHMGAHIYYALGMWEEGVDRNTRSFEEAVSRQADPNDPYGGQAYHALTWIPYGLQQWGKREEAREYIALITKQADMYPSDPVHRQHLVARRASYVIDTGEWDSELADVEIDHTGLNPYAVATDFYLQGVVSLNRGDLSNARASLAVMGGEEKPMGGNRTALSPHLLWLALKGQIEIAAGNTDGGLALIGETEALEAGLPSEYGPAVPVQPMAELLADTYLALGDHQMARQYYDDSLRRAVGRERSLLGLEKARSASTLSDLPNRGEPIAGITTSGQPSADSLMALANAGYAAVIDLRRPGEDRGFDEADVVEGLGMSYVSLPVAGADGTTFENAALLDGLLAEIDGPVLVHCGSGNRAGALLALREKLNGADDETALAVGRSGGLRGLEPTVEERLAER